MALISGSAFLIIKGVLFAAKSGAIKAAVVKYGAYLISSKGIAATVAIAAKAATVTGVVAVVSDTANNTKHGFEKIKDGFLEGSPAKVMDGLIHLRRAYSSATDLIDDFTDYILSDVHDISEREILLQSAKEFKSYAINAIQNNSIEIMSNIEQFAKELECSSEYVEIAKIYTRNFVDRPIKDYEHLLGRAGKVYNEIVHHNMLMNPENANDEYDHYLVYCIAGWIKENIPSLVYGKTQSEIASDITNNILLYLRTADSHQLLSDKFSTNPSIYNSNIDKLYKHYFIKDIASYEDFLSEAGKLYNDMLQYNYRMSKWTNRESFDHNAVFCIAGWAIQNTKYPFLLNRSQKTIAQDITDKILRYIQQS